MKRTKTQKGITLVALIITVIVLLILAVVAISAIQNDGIFKHAENAADKFEDAQDKEQGMLSEYEYLMAKLQGSTTANNLDEYILQTVYGVEVGDYVNYNPGATGTYTSETTKTGHDTNQVFNVSAYTGEWRVLGTENGKIKLISDRIVPTTGGYTLNDYTYYRLAGEKGYIYGVEELNNIGSIYGKGQYAEYGRSINLEDLINTCTDFVPGSYNENTKDSLKDKDTISQYGKEVTATITEDKITYTGNGKTIEVDNTGLFYYYDAQTRSFIRTGDISKTYKITNTYTDYYPQTNLRNTTWYKMLYDNTNDNGSGATTEHGMVGGVHVAATRERCSDSGHFTYGLYLIRYGSLQATTYCKPNDEHSAITEKPSSRGVRAVVVLDANVTLQRDNTNSTSTKTVWNIQESGSESENTQIVTPKVGQYVEYDISYVDMYNSTSSTKKTFGKTDGWRYLGTESGTGNHLLISTGVPMILYYNNTANAQWWDTTQTNANAKMVEGLKKNLANIPYAKVSAGITSTSDSNTMIGLFGDNNRTTVGDYFKVTGKTYSSSITVRTLTLAELNRAVNSAMEGETGYTQRAETETSGGFKNIPSGNTAYGLFDLSDIGLSNYRYWLASPNTGNTYNVFAVSGALEA